MFIGIGEQQDPIREVIIELRARDGGGGGGGEGGGSRTTIHPRTTTYYAFTGLSTKISYNLCFISAVTAVG